MKYIVVALTLLLTACTSGLHIDKSHQSSAQGSRVQYIVVHYTSADLNRSLELLTGDQVSSHYLIDSDSATIYQLVDENRRAWHAGVSEWQGRTWLNASTIGIELVNEGYRSINGNRQWQPYSPAQIDSLVALLKDIVKRHDLPRDSIIGHSDIAPQRKVDPGPLFPWKRLADEGLISWPDAAQVARQQQSFQHALPSVKWFQEQLAKAGFVVPDNGRLDEETRNVIAAFQMKYRQSDYSGKPDAETAALLHVVNTMAK